ncbi:MarR family winged helix-turn-helix transcriptional regulator [Streptomyces flaveolus]|uniref:MarR family winged helix-turn-helix transcriptional regulator n=1 Tax=Streptomyces flaveolus TaxID=67297 RepID=UPI00340E4E61
MKVRITPRRLAVLAAIHEQGETPPSGICHATGYGPGTVYPVLDIFERAGWIGRKPHPTRRGVSLYHLTLRGQLGAGLQPKDTTR